jgi:hypothetical protein
VNKFLLLLKSRKFWASLIGLIYVFLHSFLPDFPIPEDQLLSVVLLIVSYVLGTALEDGLSRSIQIKK